MENLREQISHLGCQKSVTADSVSLSLFPSSFVVRPASETMDVATRNPGAWACPVCTTEFDGESQLQLHMKRIHDQAETKAPPQKKKETKIHTCEARGCRRSFPSLPQLQSHKKNLHPELLVGKKKKKKKKKAKGHGSSEVMVNQQEPRSISIILSSHAKHYGFLYEIDLEKLKEEEDTQPLLDPMLEFFDEKWKIPRRSLLYGARLGCEVYLLCSEIICPYRSPLRPTVAFRFDINYLNSNLQQLPSPKSPKIWSTILSAYGKLYHLAQPSCFPYIKKDSFECYDPSKNAWESLPPYPHYSWPNMETQISGHAVLYGYILFSIISEEGVLTTAFHIATKTWHEVKLSESMEKIHDGFRGRAVVVDNIIYALSSAPDELLAFSFCGDSNGDGDGDVANRSHYLGPLVCFFIEDQAPVPCPFDSMVTQSLIHLGGRNLCLVQTSWNQYSCEEQYIIVTTFRVLSEGPDMFIQTLRSRTFRVPMDGDCNNFDIEFGFTRDFSEIEPEEGEQCVTAFARIDSS